MIPCTSPSGGSHALSRILMTADATEGIWTYVMELARALAPAGTEILLAVMGPQLAPAQRAEAACLPHVRLCEKAFALEWMQDPWRDLSLAGDWLLDLEEKFTPQVVHLNHYCHGSLPWNAPVLIAAHGCVLSLWQAVHGEQSPRSWTRYHAEVAAGLRGANLVVAPTRTMLNALIRLYSPIPRLLHKQSGARFPEFRTVPHGCDGARFRPMVKREYVLSAGRPGDEAQNLEMLDAVAKDLPWPVVLAGRAASPEEHRPALPHLNVMEAPPGEMAGQAGIFALPARYEPFGFAALEAALCGCALVLGDIPSLRETWGDAALFAPPDDAEAFGAVLHGVITDTALRREMAVRARECALEWTPARMAEGILECYKSLILHHAAPAEVDVY